MINVFDENGVVGIRHGMEEFTEVTEEEFNSIKKEMSEEFWSDYDQEMWEK